MAKEFSVSTTCVRGRGRGGWVPGTHVFAILWTATAAHTWIGFSLCSLSSTRHSIHSTYVRCVCVCGGGRDVQVKSRCSQLYYPCSMFGKQKTTSSFTQARAHTLNQDRTQRTQRKHTANAHTMTQHELTTFDGIINIATHHETAQNRAYERHRQQKKWELKNGRRAANKKKRRSERKSEECSSDCNRYDSIAIFPCHINWFRFFFFVAPNVFVFVAFM